MGSDRTRTKKKKDAPIIKVPRISIGNSGLPELVSETCPPSLEAKLEESPFVVEGIKVSLQKEGSRILIMVGLNEVGVLDKRKANTISKCMELNIRYEGNIIKKKGEYFARFFRTSL